MPQNQFLIDSTTYNSRIMKKLITIVALFCALFAAEKAQAQLNISLGYAPERSLSNIGSVDTAFWFTGFYAGINYEIGLGGPLSLAIGAQYRFNIWNHSEHHNQGSFFSHSTVRMRQNLVDIPVMMRYNIPLNSNLTLSPFVGPMFSIAVAGSTTKTVTFPYNTTTVENWYDKYSTKSRFNLYAMAGMELSYNRFNISASYRLGMLDLDKADAITTKVSGLFVSIGHRF